MRNWDYGRNGIYFITICTDNRECYFGDVKDKKLKLSEIGILADQLWVEIPDDVKNGDIGRDAQFGRPYQYHNKKWKPGILGIIINQYKRAVTINAGKINSNFKWQSRCHACPDIYRREPYYKESGIFRQYQELH